MKIFHIAAPVLLAVFGLNAGTASAAGRVEKAADALGSLLDNGTTTVQTETTDAAAMAQAYYADQYDGSDEYDFVENALKFNSETSEIGVFKTPLIGAEAALAELAYCTDNDMVDPEGNDPNANKKFLASAKKLVKSLRMPGVVFGYDANGQGWGGMPITILLVLDTKTKKVHAITMQCHAYEG